MSLAQQNPLQDAEATYARATRAELAGDFDKAFKLYVKAAEEFLHLSRARPDAASRARCKAEVAKALERAEKIKARKTDVAPVAKDHFSEREQSYVLRKSSIVNGSSYPSWKEGAGVSSRAPTQPPLSAEQTRQSAFWRRPAEIGISICSGAGKLIPEDVTQHIVSDCSFCASVAICIAHNRKFGTKLAVDSLYPQDESGVPRVTNDGLHSVRLKLNGELRRVDIDDKLPSCPNGSLMCMSTGEKREAWPALLEKAYMKVMGGYEFPGSLSSTDLYTLIGWIPEHIDISSPHFERERTWRRVAASFHEGHCMITVGTGPEVRRQLIDSFTLLPAHCYAVVDVIDNPEGRMLVILDPWLDRSPAAGSLDIAQLSLEDRNSSTRIFRVPWDLCCAVFDGMYLSWNPGIFEHQIDFHGMWRKDPSDENNLPSHFQLKIELAGVDKSAKGREVWLLLTRHVVDTRRTGEFIALSVQQHDGVVNMRDMSLKGEYTNNTQVLVQVPAEDSALSFVVSYDGLYEDVGFTVTAYSSFPISWVQESNTLAHNEKVSGTVTSKNAGGNLSLPTFMFNPQYHLRIHPDHSSKAGNRGKRSRVQLSLNGDRQIPFNVVGVWSQGQRITDVAQNDVAISSGAYSFGYASASADLQAGDYTLIVSAFESRHTGPYTFKVECSTRIELSPVPQEGSGMFSKPVRGEWTSESAGGAPKFEKYRSNPIYELNLPQQSQVRIRLQLADADPSVSLNVTLFHLTSSRTLGSLVATSGPYADTVSGVLIGDITLQAGSYAIIPSTFAPGICASFKMMVYTSSASVTITPITLAR